MHAHLGPGCTAVYVGDKMVLTLRDKPEPAAEQGVWLATTEEHHESLARDFPSLRSIELFGPKVSGRQVLPAGRPDLEEAVLLSCAFVGESYPPIGKVPRARRQKKPINNKPLRKRAR